MNFQFINQASGFCRFEWHDAQGIVAAERRWLNETARVVHICSCVGFCSATHLKAARDARAYFKAIGTPRLHWRGEIRARARRRSRGCLGKFSQATNDPISERCASYQ